MTIVNTLTLNMCDGTMLCFALRLQNAVSIIVSATTDLTVERTNWKCVRDFPVALYVLRKQEWRHQKRKASRFKLSQK